MVSIRYPSITDLSDSRGADLAFASMFDMSRGIKDERNAKKALDAFADSLYSGQGGGQQQPMSLAALEPRGAPLPATGTDMASQRVAQAHAASGGMPPQGAIEAYIRHAAQKRGIDPEIAVKVAMSEGGVTDPTRQSDVVKDGVREQSYGPFQLYMGGGLGNEFQQATGMHPSDPGAWQKGIDFALDKAKEGGWGPWYGADAAGIGARDGIGGPQAAMTGSEPSQGGGVPQSAPAGPQGGSLLPPPDVMRGLLRNPQTRELGVALAQDAIKARQGDPEAGLRLRKLQAEVQNLENPQEKPTADLQEYEFAKQQGFPGSFVDFQLAQKKAGATNVTTNVGEGNEFYKELDKKQAGIFSGLSEAGVQGRSKLAQIDRLEGLLSASETGGLAMIKQAAGEYGINTEGLSDIQAAQALINELVPQQRQPGSGPMSDADLALFKQSLPRLINQPGGNQTIVDTMRGITQYQIQMGEIADAVADRSMTPVQAREAIRNLPNPLDGFKAAGGGLPKGVSEDDIIETMRANNMTREQVMQRLGSGQ